MYLDDLREKQIEFKGKWDHELKKKYIKLEERRRYFVTKFPYENILEMKIDDYVIGKKDFKSFCYILEIALKDLGNIKGATAFKFGVYFGVTKKERNPEYRFHDRWGKNKEEAFLNVKNEIYNLVRNGKTENISLISKSKLTPMFKGKILSTYFPNRYLNMFSSEYIDYFLDKLSIHYSVNLNEVEKRELIFSFKKNDRIMREWSVCQFTEFLYFLFGRPAELKDAPQELKKYSLPSLSEIKPEVLNIEVINRATKDRTFKKGNIKYRRNYLEEYINNKKTGDRGESIVMKYEIDFLISNEKNNLAEAVRHIAKETDSAGYDILSFDLDGNQKHIEVKATRSNNIESARFMISSSELEMSKKLKNYSIYYIFDVNSKKPKIIKLKDPFSNDKISLEPVGYRAKLNYKIL